MTIDQKRTGDTLEEQIPRYRASLLRSARRLTRNREEAEDLVQETMIRAFERAETFRAPRSNDSLLPWLIVIQRNYFYNAYRHQKNQVAYQAFSWEDTYEDRCRPMSGGAEAQSPEFLCEQRSLLRAIREGFDKLPAALRQVLTLAAFEQLSYEEISERLQLPIGTVRSRLHRARARLQRAVAGYLPDAVG